MLDVMGTETVLDQHYSKCLLLCSIEVNDDRIVIFRWAIPNSSYIRSRQIGQLLAW